MNQLSLITWSVIQLRLSAQNDYHWFLVNSPLKVRQNEITSSYLYPQQDWSTSGYWKVEVVSFFFQMMTFMNESVDTFIDKVDKISETGEIVDFHKWVYASKL